MKKCPNFNSTILKEDMITLKTDDYVLDIGGNDSAFLGYYPSSLYLRLIIVTFLF